ncbi:non-structural polyprotein [Steller sea lion vesivirus]|uniref:non-structural polyprotein n=1 Tax=Steller sea lion vesivirus TaxID=436911 RepID=UPI000176C341|nr:non-structural polyprotein [Steller sea lion vesivirus]ABP88257.1 non-structural polyprotein [Steller sea lion vesivirus]
MAQTLSKISNKEDSSLGQWPRRFKPHQPIPTWMVRCGLPFHDLRRGREPVRASPQAKRVRTPTPYPSHLKPAASAAVRGGTNPSHLKPAVHAVVRSGTNPCCEVKDGGVVRSCKNCNLKPAHESKAVSFSLPSTDGPHGNEPEFIAEACPSCVLYDTCPNCTSKAINDDGSTDGTIPSWDQIETTPAFLSLLSNTDEEMSADELTNLAAHLRKAFETGSHPANVDYSKDQLQGLLEMAEAALPPARRQTLPFYQQRLEARRTWREKIFNQPIDEINKILTTSKDRFQRCAAWKVVLEKAILAKEYGEEALQYAIQALKSINSFDVNLVLKMAVATFIDHIRLMTVDNPDLVSYIPKLIVKLKPLTLKMIIDNHENTKEGWLITLTSLAELYGMVEVAIDFVPTVVGNMFDLLMKTTSKMYSMFKSIVLATFTSESLDFTNPFWYAIAAILCFLITGAIPHNGKMKIIKNILSNATGVVAGIKAIQSLAAMFSTWSNERLVNDLSSRVIAITELNNPTITADIDAVINLQRLAEVLRDEVKSHTLNPLMQPYTPILRNIMSALDNVISCCTRRKAIAVKRAAPVAVILTGPPGCGKTTAAFALAKRLSQQKPSIISLDVDHHDTYTGNEVCIIDEFDSSDKVDYANFVVNMVNTNPMVLNCDLIENKGKTFTSKYVIMTSNTETPVKPTSKRAGAFYRRVMIVDVTNNAVEKWKADNLGKPVPKWCFNKDFTHLISHSRGTEAYCKEYVLDPTGRNHQSRRAPLPHNITLEQLAQKMVVLHTTNTSEFVTQAGDVPVFGFVCQNNEIDTVYNTACCRARPGMAQISICIKGMVRTAHENSGCGAHVHVISREDNFRGKAFTVNRSRLESVPHLEGDSFRRSLGVVMSDKDVTTMFYYIKGKVINDQVNLTELPANQHVVTVHNVYDMAWALRRHLKWSGQWQLIKAAYEIMCYPDLAACALRNWMDSTDFSEDHVVTQFVAPGGTIILESCYGARMWATGQRLIRAGGITEAGGPQGGVRFAGLGARNVPWSEILREFMTLISHIWSQIKGATVVLTALTLYLKRFRPRIEAKGKNKNKGPRKNTGVALTDDEYDEWRQYKTEKKLDLTVEDFLQLRHRAAMGADDSDAVKFRFWYSERQRNYHDLEDVTIIGRGGVKRELIRKGPLRPRGNDYYDEPDDWYSEGVIDGVTHKNAIVSVDDVDGMHKGYAIHIGHGVYISLKHVVTGNAKILSEDPKDLKINGELATFRLNNILPTAVPVGTSKPIKDPWGNPVSTDWQFKNYNTTSGNIYGACGSSCSLTRQGDCGLPYVDDHGVVVGLHAGSGGDKCPSRKLIVPYVKVDMRIRDTCTKEFFKDNKPTISYKGLLVKETGDPRTIMKGTRLHVSPAHVDDYEECTHQPASLGAGDPRCPISLTGIMVNNLQPYTEASPGPDTATLNRVSKMLISHMEGYVPKIHKTEEDMISAFYMLNHDTSCGPYIGGRKKDHVQGWRVGQKPSWTSLAQSGIRAKLGLALPHEYALGLKDELRPKDKVAVGKRRLIWGCDVGVSTVCAAAFKRVSESIMANHALGFIQVGINMDGPAVEDLFKRLERSKHDRYCVDYSKWDSTQPPKVTSQSIDILRHFTDKSPIVDSACATLKSNPIGIFNGVAFKVAGGLPSGMPLTSIINSLNHCLMIGSAVVKALEDSGIQVTWNIFDSMDLFTYGDDGVYIVPPLISSVMPKVFAYLRQFGLKPTRTDKTDAEITPIPADEPVEFLKRTIVRTENGIRALLDKSSIIRQFYYIKAENTENWTTPPKKIDTSSRGQQLYNACLYASQHGEEFYTPKVVPLIKRAIEYEGLHIEVPEFHQAVAAYNGYFNGTEDQPNQIAFASGGIGLSGEVFEN